MSRSFVFNELEHILLTEFGDLIIEIARSRRGNSYEETDWFARFILLSCGASFESCSEVPFGKCVLGKRDDDARSVVSSRLGIPTSGGATGLRQAGNWARPFGAGQRRRLSFRPACRSRILSSIITSHASTEFN
jgi:hypothetical protein